MLPLVTEKYPPRTENVTWTCEDGHSTDTMNLGAGLTTKELLREIQRLKKAIGQQQLAYPYQSGQQASSDLRCGAATLLLYMLTARG